MALCMMGREIIYVGLEDDKTRVGMYHTYIELTCLQDHLCVCKVVPLYWAFCILGGSLLTEGGTLVMAIHAIRKGALQQKMTFTEYGE